MASNKGDQMVQVFVECQNPKCQNCFDCFGVEVDIDEYIPQGSCHEAECPTCGAMIKYIISWEPYAHNEHIK
jgi:hypothetical protein